MMRKMAEGREQGCLGTGKTRALAICVVAALIAVLCGCSSHSGQTGQRYHLHGKIVAVNANEGFADVNADAIPGYMAAMTMPYPIPDAHVLSSLAIGDEITADLVVTDQGPHLENVVIVKKSGAPPPSPSSSFHMPKPGEAVPDFVLTDQSGKPLRVNSYRGHFLIVTFIYTQCPFANYCPLVSHNFAEIYAAVARQPELASKVRLLSVSFDPKHDTPAVLRSYAASFRDVTGTTQPFARWKFASAPKKELPAIAHFFGLYVSDTNGQIVHSLSTTLISPEGKVISWFHGNEWQAGEVVADASKGVAAEEHADAGGPNHGHAAGT